MSSDLKDPPSVDPALLTTEPKPKPKPPDLEPKPGDVVGNYVIQSKIGQGGMGAVYRAKHKELGRVAAVKFMLAQYTLDTDAVARFQNEAKLSSRVPHPGIIQVYETGRLPTGEVFMAMEILEGHTLSQHLRAAAGTHPQGMGLEGLGILRQIASAMAVAHSYSVIHRDLKPGNLILIDDPELRDGYRVKILDFGIAKFVAPPDTPAPSHLDPVHTRTGLQVGSPYYMSPEQWKGSKELDDRVDCYALGVIAYQVLANAAPFSLEQNPEFVHRFEPPKSLKLLNPDLPDSLCQLVERMLAKEPSERPSMAEFRDELSKLMGIKPGPTTRSVPAIPVPQQLEGVVNISGPDYSGNSGSRTVTGGAAGPRPVSAGSALALSPESLAGPEHDQAPAQTAMSNRRRGRTQLAVGGGAALLLVLCGVLANSFIGPKRGTSQPAASSQPFMPPTPALAPSRGPRPDAGASPPNMPVLDAGGANPATATKSSATIPTNTDGKLPTTEKKRNKKKDRHLFTE